MSIFLDQCQKQPELVEVLHTVFAQTRVEYYIRYRELGVVKRGKLPPGARTVGKNSYLRYNYLRIKCVEPNLLKSIWKNNYKSSLNF